MNTMDQPSPLSYEYVHDTIFRKLSETCIKYRDILPEIESIEQAIRSADHENYFTLTITMIDTLKSNAERSRVVKEIFENVRMDFGMDWTVHILSMKGSTI
jgi:hypothetical protein